ncbi:RDD family protein [Streptomyces sp. NPDC048172]|uniref:RDD family protein n=1 Tax=Streptomyces sp. NPDC048172 TaxID=3365505 RepID=UPI003710753C
MSTEQPENDPFRKPEQPEQPSPPPSSGGGGSPYDSAPPPPPPPPGGGDGAAGPYGGGPYGGSGPYAGPGPYDNPYGGTMGAADPLAGMPPLASRGRRLVARIIDALLIGIPVGIVVGLAQGGYSTDTGQTYWQQAVYTLVYLIYEGAMLTARGQTVGKKLMKIRVGMLSNGTVPHGSPGWFRAATYSLPALVPCLGFLFWLVNVLFCTWDKPYQQCVHDKAARTVVVATD